jgi:hypothetical protein
MRVEIVAGAHTVADGKPRLIVLGMRPLGTAIEP